jgi:hypothetical protein
VDNRPHSAARDGIHNQHRNDPMNWTFGIAEPYGMSVPFGFGGYNFGGAPCPPYPMMTPFPLATPFGTCWNGPYGIMNPYWTMTPAYFGYGGYPSVSGMHGHPNPRNTYASVSTGNGMCPTPVGCY